MALILSLTESTGSIYTIITDDGTTIELEDNTGDYDVSSNPGGYGSPNDARASIGLKLFITRQAVAGDEVMTVTNYDDTDPGAVTKFRFTNTDGGVYNALFCGVLDYAGGTTYADGELAYNPTTEKFYESLQDSNTGNALTDTDYWRDLSTLTQTAQLAVFRVAEELTSSVMYFTDVSEILMVNLQIIVNRAILDANCECVDFCKIARHNELQMKADAALILSADGDYSEAQEIYENAMNLNG